MGISYVSAVILQLWQYMAGAGTKIMENGGAGAENK